MSWNHPTTPSKPVKTKSPSPLRGILAGVAVVAVLGVALFIVLSGDKSAPAAKTEKKPVVIKEVKPAPAPKAAAEVPPAKDPWQVKADALMEGKDPDDWMVIKDEDGEPKVIRVFHPARQKDARPPLFKHSSENELCRIMCGDMGERVIGFTIDNAFKKDLASALVDKIEFEDTDTDEDREKKQAVIEAKEMLKGILKDGGDPYKVIRDAVNERNRVAALKENLQAELAQAKREGQSEEEIALIREAANKMLKDTGAKLFMSPAERREHLRQKQLERMNKEKAK